MNTDLRVIYKNIGEQADRELFEKSVSIVGLGGAGAMAASLLGREGIALRLVDMGRVEEEDMHRLSLFYDEDITKFKVKQAKARINAINPTVPIKSFHEELTDDNIFLLKGDCIIDATNDIEINKKIFKFATEKKIPLVTVRYSGDQGRILVTQKKLALKAVESIQLEKMTKRGIFGPVTAMAGSCAVAQVMKVLLGEKASFSIELDAWKPKIKLTKL